MKKLQDDISTSTVDSSNCSDAEVRGSCSPTFSWLSKLKRALGSARNRPSHPVEGKEVQQRTVITGMGTKWPETVFGPEVLEKYVMRWYDVTNPEIAKLLSVNRRTGINTRASINVYEQPMWNQDRSPTIEELDTVFREKAVPLTTSACQDAIREWGGNAKEITHSIAVTATNAGNPGYDHLVAQQLGLSPDVNRTLLHGVGCAGGLSVLRHANLMAQAANARKEPARILIYACEICSIQIRSELDAVKNGRTVGIGPALFSDGASAMVVCNQYALGPQTKGVYSLMNAKAKLIPESDSHMGYRVTSLGFKLNLSKDIPVIAINALKSMVQEIVQSSNGQHNQSDIKPTTVDWALHPGGLAVLKQAQSVLGLTDEALRASYSIYQERGNTSSVAVLAVLNKLRDMGYGKEDVLACSFGPGVMIEAAWLKRCR